MAVETKKKIIGVSVVASGEKQET